VRTALEQLVQIGAEPAGFLGGAHRILHLPKDLRLAQHHRIEAGSDAEGVAHGFVLGQHVEMGAQLGVVQRVVMRQELGRGIERIGQAAGGIQLGAVAGGKNCGFIAAAALELAEAAEPLARRLHRAAELLRAERELFA